MGYLIIQGSNNGIRIFKKNNKNIPNLNLKFSFFFKKGKPVKIFIKLKLRQKNDFFWIYRRKKPSPKKKIIIFFKSKAFGFNLISKKII